MKSTEKGSIIFSYFLKLFVHHSPETRFYTEKFILKLKGNSGIIFIILKFLSNQTEYLNFSLFLIILLKNLFESKSENLTSYEKHLILQCLVDILVCCPMNLFNKINKSILNIFEFGFHNISHNYLFFNRIIDKLSMKLIGKNKQEFFYHILSILEIFICSYLETKKTYFGTDSYLRILEKCLLELFIKIGKIDSLHINESHFNSVNSLSKLFRLINKHFLVTFLGKDMDNWILIFLFLLNNEDTRRTDLAIKLNQNIITSITDLSFVYQNEFSIYLPIFCYFGLKRSNFYIIQTSTIIVNSIISINSSANNSIIFQNKKFREKVGLLLFQLITYHIDLKKEFSPFPIVVFSDENFNFIKRFKLAFILITSVDIRKRKSIFLPNQLFYITCNLQYPFLVFIFTTVVSILYSNVNGTSIKGIYTTYEFSLFKNLFNYLIEGCGKLIDKKFFISYVDLTALFRYQFSLKIITKSTNYILKASLENKNLTSHSLFTLEKLLCIRGNSETGIIMFFHGNICGGDFLSFLLTKIDGHKFTDTFYQNLKKLFLRIFLNNLETNKIRVVIETYILNNFKKVQQEKKTNILSLYDFEILNLIIFSSKTIDINLTTEFLRVGIDLVIENQLDMFPYIFDTFASIVEAGGYDAIPQIFSQVLKCIFNPHIWSSKILIKSLLGYLKIFIIDKKYKFDKQEIISICCIIQIILPENIEVECFLTFLIFFLDTLENQSEFIPHLMESLLNNRKYIIKRQFSNSMYIFLILLVGKIGVKKTILACNLIQKNFLFNLFETLTSQFLNSCTKYEYDDILYRFSEIFFENILKSEVANLECFIGRIIRHITCFLKILEKKNKECYTDDFDKQIRFKKTKKSAPEYQSCGNKFDKTLSKIYQFISSFSST
nr:exportin-2 [Cryptomonas sp.]